MSTERYQGTHPHVVRACEGTAVNARDAANNPTLMRLNSALGQAETHAVNGNTDAARQVLEVCGPIVAELDAVARAAHSAYDDVAERIGPGSEPESPGPGDEPEWDDDHHDDAPPRKGKGRR